jgi:hypothetical protein
MVTRTQITLDSEMQRRARRRASELGISLAEYLRGLVSRDLSRTETKLDVSCVFDLGHSDGSNIANHKDEMIGEAMASLRKRPR